MAKLIDAVRRIKADVEHDISVDGPNLVAALG